MTEFNALLKWMDAEREKEARPRCSVHEFHWEPRLFGGEVQRCKICGFHVDGSWRPLSTSTGNDNAQ